MKKVIASVLITLLSVPAPMLGVSNAYKQTNLVSDIPGKASHTDPQLVNPWGIAFSPGSPFWVSDNKSGFSTLYDASGNKSGLVVTIPPESGTGLGTPTGIVFNSTPTSFNGYHFIFATEDGLIAGWNSGTTAVIAVDESGSGAVYKGLAVITNSGSPYLLATDFRNGLVDVFDGAFNPHSFGGGTFVDPNLPANYAPFGIHVIGGNVYVTYAEQDAAKHDPVLGPGLGFVSVFDVGGNFIERFASNGKLNAPWGVVMAPATGFGSLSNTLLIGNFGDGNINAFNPGTGAFKFAMKNAVGNAIANSGLWDMVFGAGGTGSPTTLYVTAGIQSEAHGLFASLSVVPQTLLPASLKFSTAVGTTSASKIATLSNNTASSIPVSGIATSGSHFVITSNTCGSMLAAGANCIIKVAFRPTATGTITGTLKATAGGAALSLKLTGTGT